MARASRHYIPGFIWHPDYDSFRNAHRGWVEAEVERSGGGHQAHWTQSIAVGSKAFVETVQQKLSFRALGRRKRPFLTVICRYFK